MTRFSPKRSGQCAGAFFDWYVKNMLIPLPYHIELCYNE